MTDCDPSIHNSSRELFEKHSTMLSILSYHIIIVDANTSEKRKKKVLKPMSPALPYTQAAFLCNKARGG
jgi:hypothetical protein